MDLEIVVPHRRRPRKPYARSVTVDRAPEEQAVDGHALRRIRVGDYVRQALLFHARRLSEAREGDAEGMKAAWGQQLAARGRGHGRRAPPRSAALYREALADDEHRRAPTVYVSAQMQVSLPATAARYIATARQKRFLGKALGRRAGEGAE